MKEHIRQAILLGFLLLFSLIQIVNSVTSTWIVDAIIVTSNVVSNYFSIPPSAGSTIKNELANFSWVTTLEVSANGEIYEDITGNFRLNMVARDSNSTYYKGSSTCIHAANSDYDAEALLRKTTMVAMVDIPGDGEAFNTGMIVKLEELVLIDVVKNYNKISSTEAKYIFTITFSSLKSIAVSEYNIYDMSIALSYETGEAPCSPWRTVGLWSDTSRWSTGTVPSTTTDVVIPAGAGVLAVTTDIQVNKLTMAGGLLLSYVTGCPDGWSVNPDGASASKCYKLYETALPYYEAEDYCHYKQRQGLSDRNSLKMSATFSAHLVQIADRDENEVLRRICRGTNTSSPAAAHGCWIGLRDQYGNGDFEWLNTKTVGSDLMFTDWRRTEAFHNNHTSAEGIGVNGEWCAGILPHTVDPLIEEQGAWDDEACSMARPFICQIYKITERFTIIVTNAVSISGGGLEGGLLEVRGAGNSIRSFEVFRSASVTLLPGSSTTLGTIKLVDGSSLLVLAAATVSSSGESVEIGEGASSGDMPLMQSMVVLGEGVTLSVATDFVVSARVDFSGAIVVAASGSVELQQGGTLSAASIDLQGLASDLLLTGYGSRLSTVDHYSLNVRNQGIFLGEYYGNTTDDATLEYRNRMDEYIKGVYRLKATTKAGVTEVTQCIPYNATAHELKAILDALPSVTARGMATVRRYGDQNSVRHLFGYTYTIMMDNPSSAMFQFGPLDLAFSCYGIGDCDCAETKVPEKSGLTPRISQCYPNEHPSVIRPTECTLTPGIAVTRISALNALTTLGSGSIAITNGMHRLPWKSTLRVSCSQGTGIVNADRIEWYGAGATDTGTIVVGGSGWAAIDSTNSLYTRGQVFDYNRAYKTWLDSANRFSMTAETFYLAGAGSVVSSVTGSTLTWVEGVLAGGILGGRVDLFISSYVNCTGTLKALRNGITLTVMGSATMDWDGGDISLASGANMVILGDVQVMSASPVTIGMALLMSQEPKYSEAEIALMAMSTGRDWDGYFDDQLIPELRPGWYENPLCGLKCWDTNTMTADGVGTITIVNGSSMIVQLPIKLIGESQLVLGSNVTMEMKSGGECGNAVVMNIGDELNSGSTLSLSGGQMLMRAFCTIKGSGLLEVVAGQHDLSFKVNTDILISGGYLVWPATNSDGLTINFYGALTIVSGELSVKTYNTKINVYGIVTLLQDSVVSFPLLGIMNQASPFDGADAPDATTPRGSFICHNTWIVKGGRISGKADFTARKDLYLDSDTPGAFLAIEDLAKLRMESNTFWGALQLRGENYGDGVNFGSVQMLYGADGFASEFTYKGSILPVKAGGDVFAYNYHTTDQDNGGMNYDDYLAAREQYVSRLPSNYIAPNQQDVR